MLNYIVRYFLENRLVTFLITAILVVWGLAVAPFDWGLKGSLHNPIAVDAIPDIGENQQIIFTEWAGRSPQDIENQITYPLTTALLGMKGLKTVRSFSDFGFASVYLIFDENIEFYEARSRILEKINALPQGTLPVGVQPKLSPDATALGQIFWYTLEGQDSLGNTTGGWDLHELRSLQDFYVRYALNAVDGVAEVASIGGHIKEYQVEVNPAAMQAHGITLMDVLNAVRKSNLDVGANTLEINKVEYFIRGIGYVKKLEDLEESVVTVRGNVPIKLKDVAFVTIGAGMRRGILDKSGAEVVGGVVVARYGANPMQVIESVKTKIKEIEVGLPSKKLDNGTVSQVKIVPFYDRSVLIQETLGTLNEALAEEILITIIVVLVMLKNVRASLLISGLLPLAVLMSFIGMKLIGVDANIVSLSGIAIAIGTIVDVGIILAENLVKRLEINKQNHIEEKLLTTIGNASAEVSGAVLTSISTTIVSFIPIFLLENAEGKLFAPLAYTKTFALAASVFITLVMMPTCAYWFFSLGDKWQNTKQKIAYLLNGILILVGLFIAVNYIVWLGIVLIGYALNGFITAYLPKNSPYLKYADWMSNGIAIVTVAYLLTIDWLPLGADFSLWVNFLFVSLFLAAVLGFFEGYQKMYPYVLKWCLANKFTFLSIPSGIILTGIVIWLGFDTTFGWLANGIEKLGYPIRQTSLYSTLHHSFQGIGKEFMPALDEGAFLLMPTLMPHAGIEDSKDNLQLLDMAVTAIPEVATVVGKAGRTESALDPAPLTMFENVVLYKSEYITDENGNKIRFKVDEKGRFLIRKNKLSVSSYQLPVISNQLLVTSNQLLEKSNQLLVTSNQLLEKSNQLSVTNNQLLEKSNQLPVKSNQLLVNSHQLSVTSNQSLVNSHHLLTTKNLISSNSTNFSSNVRIFIGSESILEPRESIFIGSEDVFIGRESILYPRESIFIGSEDVFIGRESIFTYPLTKKEASESIFIGRERIFTSPLSIKEANEHLFTSCEDVFDSSNIQKISSKPKTQLLKAQFFGFGDEKDYLAENTKPLSIKNDTSEYIAIEEKDQPYIDVSLLIPDKDGRYFRQWRKEIKNPQDIWDEIVKVTNFPWITSSPKLQPIETRLVMLQTGMRAPLGIKVKGTDLETIEKFGIELEQHLKNVPAIKSEAVFADRIVGKPYIEVEWDRSKLARYGISIQDAQMYLESVVGGMPLTTTVEGRERYPIRVRYPRALREDVESIKKVLIPTMMNVSIPLGELADIHYKSGAQMIKSEDTFFVGYVLLDKNVGYSEVDAVEAAQEYLQQKIASGELKVPTGISYRFSGAYENQIRAEARLMIVVPLCLLSIFLLLYFEFRNVLISLMVFSGVATVFGGGFMMIWLYGQSWFMDFSIAGLNMRELFQISPINLSVAVWVGFIALFGISDDDGVVMATYLESSFEEKNPQTIAEIREAVLQAGLRRIRPCMMTTATAMIALLPVLTSTGRGADIMIPMAIPSIGGMFAEMLSIYIVPVLYAMWKERKLKSKK
jgi:Cu/Ag efflux pump CusA